MDIEGLKAVAKAERKLEEKGAEEQIKVLLPFEKDVPGIAQIIYYLRTYRQPIPEGHQVFRYIKQAEELKSKSGNLETESESDSVYGEEKEEDAQKLLETVFGFLSEMEKENDKAWYFLEENKAVFQNDFRFRTKFMNLRNFLKSNKSLLQRLRK